VKVSFTDKEYVDFNNPSIDCLMSSAAQIFGRKLIGAILTGMGKDGGKGLLDIQKSGGLTIAQDEASSVVYGMPKYALDIGATNRQVPIDQLAGYIMSVL
jgi:two-component system chemotaxis response regulator CheB